MNDAQLVKVSVTMFLVHLSMVDIPKADLSLPFYGLIMLKKLLAHAPYYTCIEMASMLTYY